MTSRGLDRIDLVEEWLAEGPRVAPEHLLASVAIELPGTPQERTGGIGRFGWAVAPLVAASIMLAVVLAIGTFRPPTGNPGPSVLAAIRADLQSGEWVSSQIAIDDWKADLVALGHNPIEVDAFVGFGAQHQRVRYIVTMVDDELSIFGPVFRADNYGHGWASGTGTIALGAFEVLDDRRLYLDMAGCLVTVGFELDGDTLTFGSFEARRCSHDEKIRLSGALLLTPLTRVGP